MSNLYDDLMQNQIMPRAFSDWAAYRGALTDFILEHTEPGASALIVGAGPCNDFDLARLKAHFSKLTLLDRDERAMERGLLRQGVSWAPEEFLCADLVGIRPDAYRRIADTMLALLRAELVSGDPDASRFQKVFLEQIAAAFQSRRPDALMARADLSDYVICCGVHSQLLTTFPQMALVYGRYIPISYEAVAAQIREQLPAVVSELNDALLRWAKKGLILGLEEGRLGQDGGINGAWQALEDMERRGLPAYAQTRLIWPFDPAQDKAYSVRVLAIERADRRPGG